MNHRFDGMSYFPMDTEILTQPDLAYVACKYHSLTYHFYLHLLCQAYHKNGYYIFWSPEASARHAKRTMQVRTSTAVLDELVRQFVEVGLFDMDIYDKYGILTSQEMQTNFYNVISKRKGQEQESYDYWLLGELEFARPNPQKS